MVASETPESESKQKRKQTRKSQGTPENTKEEKEKAAEASPVEVAAAVDEAMIDTDHGKDMVIRRAPEAVEDGGNIKDKEDEVKINPEEKADRAAGIKEICVGISEKDGKSDAKEVNVETGKKAEENVGKEAEVYGGEEIKKAQVEERRFEVNQEEHNNVDINPAV